MSDPATIRDGSSNERVRIGLDIGGTKTHGVAMVGDRIVAQQRRPTARGAVGVLETAAALSRALEEESGGAAASIGVGVPGLVDPERGIVEHAVNLAVGDFPLADRLGGLCGVPVAVENDVNVAALGAKSRYPDSASLALVNLGTGLAVGVVLGDRIHRGGNGAAGEIGHLSVDAAGDVCACGQRGCLELAVSGTAFRRMMEHHGVTSALDLLIAADGVTPAAARARDEFFDRLAWTIHVIALSVDVEQFALAGGITELGPAFDDRVVEALRRREHDSPFLAALGLPRRIASLPPDFPAGARGAALYGSLSSTHALEAPVG